MKSPSSVGLAIGILLFLFIVYLFLESRELDSRGHKRISPQKLGKVLKKVFGYCIPEFMLLAVANCFIFCGFVGNSCMEHIHNDEDIRDSKKIRRLAATLSRSKMKSSRKRDDSAEGLFSSDDDSQYNGDSSDEEKGTVDSGYNSGRNKSKLKSHLISGEDVDAAHSKVILPTLNLKSKHNFQGTSTSRTIIENNTGLRPEEKMKPERIDKHLNLSEHSVKSNHSIVSRESLQALIAAEDNSLAHRQAIV